MHVRGRGFAHRLCLVGVVGALVLVAGLPAASGQFVGERFAPMATAMEQAPELSVRALTIEPDGGSGQTFVVTFESGFVEPPDGYRVMVSVGDPTGKRTRWAGTFSAGASTGTVETGDGIVWDPGGPATVSLDAAAGRAVIEAQPADIAPDSAVWVEAEIPTPGGPLGAITTYFSYDSLVSSDATTVPTSSWAWLRNGDGIRVEGAARVPGAPPAVEAVDQTLVLTSADAPPTFLLDQPVTATVDLLRLFGADSAQNGGYLLFNRVTGEVQVFGLQDGEPTEVEGAGETVVAAAGDAATAPAAPPTTRSLSVDVAALTTALGLPNEPSDLAVTVDRAFTLGDGSVATTTGVASTVASLVPVAAQTPEPTQPDEPVADDVVVVDDSDDGIPLVAVLVVAGVALLALAAVAVALLARRRRERERSFEAEGWFAPASPTLAPPTPARPPSAPPPDLAPSARPPSAPPPDLAPAARPPSAPPPPPPPLVVPVADEAQAAPSVQAGVAAANNGRPAEAEEQVEITPEADDDARATQDRALADLDEQVAALIQRVDRLGGSDEGSD